MGYSTKANKSLHIQAVVRILKLVKEEADDSPPALARELYKFGAAVVVAKCGSLRGPEILTLDLAGMHAHIQPGPTSEMPANPMKLDKICQGCHMFSSHC